MIRMEKVGKCYPGRHGQKPLWALREIDLHIRPGEYAALVGASGSGKSTLMHILGCLDSPTEGRYLLDGQDVSGYGPKELCQVRREKIGFVFQGFQLLQKLTALENVAFPLMIRGMGEGERRRTAMRALERVGLGERAGHRSSELSGGQQQRVAMARALCYQPGLLLCDEPTGALDAESRDDMLDMFDQLHRAGHTIVLITHDREAAGRARIRYRVENGRLSTETALPCTLV